MTQEQSQSPDPTPTPPLDEEEQGEQLVLTSPEDVQTPRDFALWAGVILLAALTIYSPALRGDFLWDDNRHVSENRNLRDFDGLVRIWTKLGYPAGGTVQYYPLTHTTFWLEYQLSGARPGEINPMIFHVTNVVLHVIGAILLWLVLRELKVPGSWVAAAIWALHPIQVESVAWMSERKNVLAGAFFFGSILAYLRSGMGLREGPRRFDGMYWLALGLYACALLSKTASAAAPAVVLLLLWWKRGLNGRDWLATAPFFAIGLVMAWVTSSIETGDPLTSGVGARGPEWEIPFQHRILIAGRAIWFYVEKNLIPLNLAFIYPRWDLSNATAAWWFFPAAVLAVIAVLFALRNRIGRGPLVAFLIFCGVLLPALGFFNFYPMRYSFVADHFQYLAGPALIALIVAAVTALMRRLVPHRQAAPYVLAGIALVVLSALTLMQAWVYAGPLLLWDDAIKKNPTSPMLRRNYGVDLMKLTDRQPPLPPQELATFVDEAIRQFQAAVKLEPDHGRAWMWLGKAQAFRGRHEDAIASFDKALAIWPEDVDALLGKGLSLYELKRNAESQKWIEKALAAALEQKSTGGIPRILAATIYQYLGRLAEQGGDLEPARQHYAEAAKIGHDSSVIRYEYGLLLAKLAKEAEAKAAATRPATTQAALTRPATAATSPATRPATAPASEEAKKLMAAAAVELASAIELRPDYVDARVALANLMMDVGNLVGAQAQLNAVAQILRAQRVEALHPGAEAAAKRWNAEITAREAAATQPATTRAATQPTTMSQSDRGR